MRSVRRKLCWMPVIEISKLDESVPYWLQFYSRVLNPITGFNTLWFEDDLIGDSTLWSRSGVTDA